MKIAAEVGTDVDDKPSLFAIDYKVDFFFGQKGLCQLKNFRSFKPGQKLPGFRRAGLVEYRVAHIFEVIRRGIPEHEKLDQRWTDNDKTTFGVLKDHNEFFEHQCNDAAYEIHQPSSRLVILRKARLVNNTAITARAKALGSSTAQTSPAMKRVWLMDTKYRAGTTWLTI